MNRISLVEMLAKLGLSVAERRDLAGRDAVFSEIPDCLSPLLRRQLSSRFGDQIYCHQALAIESAVAGRSLCLATGMASGKSLVFMAVAAHTLLEDASARVLALYPAKALIRDQMSKWAEILSATGIDFGYIDGDVPMDKRLRLLRTCRLILATPDVAHAWLLASPDKPAVRDFLKHLRLLILDEAHVYEGVFGSNMAYFLRRLRAVAGLEQCICSTATLAEPVEFMRLLTGLDCLVIDSELDGSPQSPKTVMLVRAMERRPSNEFRDVVELIAEVSRTAWTPFLAFADSRLMVERIVALLARAGRPGPDEDEPSDDREPAAEAREVLPYRAGYEAVDREGIQQALTEGSLKGVVSTSALELGLDIGEIDLVIMVTPPATVKTFWQRLGRAGRVNHGTCLLLDLQDDLGDEGLSRYMDRPVEPNRLYLGNRYLQYVNALCAAAEVSAFSVGSPPEAFNDLSGEFMRWLRNELDPQEPVPPDLYPLKQKAQERPHLEFPIRTGLDREFQVVAGERPLGTVSLSQMLKEAYPGAVYYYLGRPYRVVKHQIWRDRIEARRERYYTTDPVLQQMAFPRWTEGVLALRKGPDGQFVMEAEMQVSERCTGFVEKRGPTRERHDYGPDSPYAQKPIYRFVQTTGVLWWFPGLKVDESVARRILTVFCREAGIHEADVDLGQYHVQLPWLGTQRLHDWCVYDRAWGGLRLTADLVPNFHDVVAIALGAKDLTGEEEAQLRMLYEASEGLSEAAVESTAGLSQEDLSGDDNWVKVIARGQRALLRRVDLMEEVVVKDFRYTPKGIVYELVHSDPEIKWTVPESSLVPIPGETKLVLWNLISNEEKPID